MATFYPEVSFPTLSALHEASPRVFLVHTVEQQEPGHGRGGVRGGLHLQYLQGLAGSVEEDKEVLDQVVGLMVRV